ncbi:aspartate/glutamate racemase family protein [Ancylobacter sp. 6x-1]|uniref:Aspartate/glutamate racemase family protein n=1 Tax=Ancylobacter crimeensis TaxID=2579147 RepID=A0ABT0DDZ8_9HYPH|nr:aspartate/glutamate racemase family protein [Ancylobacter crimeensis]MCK0198195.1 aspartate/glutamate racemase family protein [Ancylobacter crimeensis]
MRDFTGWRARIGLIYMASSTVMEPEFYAMAPEGVSIHTTRIPFQKASPDGIRNMMARGPLEDAAELLATAPLDACVFGGTSASFLEGRGFNDIVAQRMRSVMGDIPVTTASTAALTALHTLGVRRMTFIGPYIDEVTARGRAFFEANGISVLGAHGLGVTDDIELGLIPLDRIYRFARERFDPASDAVFISCTNITTVGAIEALEQDLGVPVVSAIQSSFWHALGLAGVGAPVTGFGSLFSHKPVELVGASLANVGNA